MIKIHVLSTHPSDHGHTAPLVGEIALDRRFQNVPHSVAEVVVFQGDRTELLTEAHRSTLWGQTIVHLAGGERSKGSTDDLVRDAMTKLAHLHCPVHEQARDRLLALQEEAWRICVTGEVGVDEILSGEREQISYPCKAGDMVVAIHPPTARPDEMPNLLWAAGRLIEAWSGAVWISQPNGDPGSHHIMGWARMLESKRRGVLMDRCGAPAFREIIRRCGYIAGNSSAILTEAPHLGAFPILLGTRQEGRMPAPSDGKACQRILDHIAACIERPDLRVKA